ncbi:hypothetical protein ABPG72_008519 [Tetrahymena utriculariae]
MEKDQSETPGSLNFMEVQQNNIKNLKFQQSESDFHTIGDNFIVDKKYLYVGNYYEDSIKAINKENGQKVLIKKIKKQGIDQLYLSSVINAIKIENHFQHENIDSNLHIINTSNDLYIVRELMNTDLKHIIVSSQELTDDHIRFITYQILRGLLYLHSQNIYHHFLTPLMILINQNCDVKIRNFTYANPRSKQVLNRWYRSPEINIGFEGVFQKYGKESDIWSVGVIMLELFTRNPIFSCGDNQEYSEKFISILGTPSEEDMFFLDKDYKILPNQSKQFWQSFFPLANPLLVDLADKMIVFNPEKRYTAIQCLKHPYFQDLYIEQEDIPCKEYFDHEQLMNQEEEEKFTQIEEEISTLAGKSYLKQHKKFQVYIIQFIAFQKHLAGFLPLNPRLIFYNLFED